MTSSQSRHKCWWHHTSHFLYWVKRIIQYISGHIRTVSVCNRGYDNHFIVLYDWNITPQAQWYDILTGHIILATGLSVFTLNYPLYVEHLTIEVQLPISNIWLESAGNWTQASQTRRASYINVKTNIDDIITKPTQILMTSYESQNKYWWHHNKVNINIDDIISNSTQMLMKKSTQINMIIHDGSFGGHRRFFT